MSPLFLVLWYVHRSCIIIMSHLFMMKNVHSMVLKLKANKAPVHVKRSKAIYSVLVPFLIDSNYSLMCPHRGILDIFWDMSITVQPIFVKREVIACQVPALVYTKSEILSFRVLSRKTVVLEGSSRSDRWSANKFLDWIK